MLGAEQLSRLKRELLQVDGGAEIYGLYRK